MSQSHNPPRSLKERRELISLLTTLCLQTHFQLFNHYELGRVISVTETEFRSRADEFIRWPESGVPGGEEARELCIAVLAKLYANHLDDNTFAKLTQPLRMPAPRLPVATLPEEKEALRERLRAESAAVMNRKPAPPKAAKKAVKKTSKKAKKR